MTCCAFMLEDNWGPDSFLVKIIIFFHLLALDALNQEE